MTQIRPKASSCALIAGLLLMTGCQGPTVQAVQAPMVAPVTQLVPAPPVLAIAPNSSEHRILVTVQFGLNDHTIRPESFPLLDNIVAAMKDERLRNVSYEIDGHTDLRGKLSYNIALSALRAKAVSDYLRNAGVQTPPIRAQGFGPLQLLYAKDPFNAGNRRVEIIAISP